jgi:RNA polymerase sigma-70 factor (ECF subfamily)
MNTTSVTLLERLRLPGEQEAWRRFVRLYTPLLLYWAGRLGLHEQDAADLVQDVFALLVRKLPRFQYDRGKSFRAWLRTVLRNVWRNRRPTRSPDQPETGGIDPPDRAGTDPADELSEAEYRQHLVARALELMQADFQPVTWKACWELVVNGRPAAEVAAELGTTANAVYLAKSRVLRRLRRELDGLLD